MSDKKNVNARNANERDFQTNCVISDKGTGKSTWMLQDAVRIYWLWKRAGKDRPILIDDPAESAAYALENNFDSSVAITPISIEELVFGKKSTDGANVKALKFGERTGIYLLRASTEISEELRYGISKLLGIPILQVKKMDNELRISIIAKAVRNSTVYLDESNKYLRSSVVKECYFKYITEHRNYGVDLYLMFHSFMEISMDIRGHINRYVIGITADNFVIPKQSLLEDNSTKDNKIKTIKLGIKNMSEKQFPNADRAYFAYAYNKIRGRNMSIRMQDFIIVEKYDKYDFRKVFIADKGELKGRLVEQPFNLNLEMLLAVKPFDRQEPSQLPSTPNEKTKKIKKPSKK